ncbi:MAG: tetratricopeptide repeat protein [candidate division WOR-3 bacterium]|nr:tetratricopeptide repeat protein [candidate division WOR-3 bacterium]
MRPFVVLLAAVVLLGAGCAYYNTFYNARSSYRDGLKLKDQNQKTQAKAKFDKAIEKSALVIKHWPKSRWVDDALFLVGTSYYQEGQYGKAIREFDQLSLAFPNSGLVPESELYRGLALLADQQYGTARLALDAVRQKYPRFASDAAYNLAKSFIDRDELERGTDSLAAFVERFPKSRFRRPAVKSLADALFTLKRYADAEKWYAFYARLSSDPKERALARLKIAACRYEQGKYEEAVAEVTDVLGRYPELDDEANLLLGKALTETGKQMEAFAAWVKVRGTGDLGAEAAFRIGKHHEEGADFDKARAYYDTAKTRRVDSDYGVLAVKRLALLDALAARETGKKTGGDSLTPAEAMFLVAEVNNLNLGDYDKAMGLYQKVYDSFPGTDWAAKALFAKAWIVRNTKNDTAGAMPILKQVIAEYPETEYADESRRWLGLPVPKRASKKPEVKPETTAAVLPAGESTMQPGIEPLPRESLPGDTGEVAARRGPDMFPRGPHAPGRFPAGTVPERGLSPESGKAGATLPHSKGESPVAKPNTGAKGPGVRGQGGKDTIPVPQPPRPDTTKQPRPPEKPAPTTPAARVQLEIAHFATDSWEIQAADTARLRADAESLKAHTDVKITIVGHCDPRASETYNRELGRRRAQAVKDFLVAAGVGADRVRVRSEGKKRPISTKPDEYWLDRRIEFEFR